MKNNNETVEQVCEEGISHLDPERRNGWSELFNRILAAYKRELAEKDTGLKTVTLNYENVIAYMDNLVAGMKACRDGECERIKFGAELCDGCHWQLSKNALEAKDTEIASLRSLVKELADATVYPPPCEDCDESCENRTKCAILKRRKLIEKAREACHA